MAAGAALLSIIFFVVYLSIIAFLYVIPMWKIFKKAGFQGWESIVPFYNLWVMVKIAKKPESYFWVIFGCTLGAIIPLLGFISMIVAIVYIVMTWNGISKAFGKDEGFTVGLVLLGIVFIPILGYGDAKYQFNEVEDYEIEGQEAAEENRIVEAKDYIAQS